VATLPTADVNLSLDGLVAVDWDFSGSSVSRATHRLHPWPARFVPQIPATAIDYLSDTGDLVIDPFCGCGTTALEARLAGRGFSASDSNPLAVLITRAKCFPPKAPTRARIETWSLTLRPQRSATGLLRDAPEIPNRDYWFSRPVTAQLVYLLNEIAELAVAQDFLRVVFSSIVTGVSRQESETRYRRVEREVSPTEVVERFRRQLGKALLAAADVDDAPIVEAVVEQRDARVAPSERRLGQLAVFSPPYPNSFDYHLYHRFRMFWLGFDPVAAKHSEIGAHLRYEPDESAWLQDMRETFIALGVQLEAGGHVVCVVGDGVIRGQLVQSAALLSALVPALGFDQLARFDRAVPPQRKSFKSSDGRLREETVLVFKRS